MAVAIIVMVIVSIFAVGMAILSFQPAVFELAFKTSFFEDGIANQRIQIFRDVMYNASLAIPIFMIAVIIIWGYLSANRRAEV
jgi:hypothetical protein